MFKNGFEKHQENVLSEVFHFEFLQFHRAMSKILLKNTERITQSCCVKKLLLKNFAKFSLFLNKATDYQNNYFFIPLLGDCFVKGWVWRNSSLIFSCTCKNEVVISQQTFLIFRDISWRCFQCKQFFIYRRRLQNVFARRLQEDLLEDKKMLRWRRLQDISSMPLPTQTIPGLLVLTL